VKPRLGNRLRNGRLRLRGDERRAQRGLGRRTLVALGATVIVLAIAACALAFWSAQGSGSASGSVGSLAAPSITNATPGAGTVALTWSTVSAPGSGSVTYYVSRDGGAASAACPSAPSPTSATSCTDTGVPAGSHSYTVTAVWRSWTATSASKSVEVASAAATHLVLAATTTSPTAGTGDNLTITAENASNETVTGYTGSKSLTFGGAATLGANVPSVTNSAGTTVNFGSATAIVFTNGVASVSGGKNGVMTLYKAQTTSITVSDGTINSGSGLAVTVSPAGASSFTVPTPGMQTAGSAFEETLTALDAYGNTATGYTGSKTVTFSGPSGSPNSTAPKYPVSVSFSAGVGKASITLYKAESTTLTAKEGSIAGTSGGFTVAPATAASLSLSAASTTPTAGEADNLSIAAFDAYGNAATAYTGAHALTFGGASAVGANKPTVSDSAGAATAFGTATSISFTSGIATVSGANNGVMKLYSAETAKVTVSDGTINNGSGLSVTVAPAAIASIAVTTPATQTAGTAFNLAITAKDTYGNGVSGSQALTSSGPANSPNSTAPSYPASVSFTNGSGTASVTLTDAQSTTITVKQGAVSGTSGSFTVNPAPGASFSLSTPATQTAGTAFTETVTALDSFGNTATSYKEAHTITFSGPANSPSGKAPNYPASVTFASGKGEASMTLFDAQTTTLTAKEGTVAGTSGSFVVNPASAASFSLSTPATQTAGTAFTETVTALDSFGNTATSYKEAHTITFSGPANSPSGKAPNYPASVTFASGKGEASMTLFDAQTTTLTAKDATLSLAGTSGSFTVAAAAASSMSLVNCSLNAKSVACASSFALGNGGEVTGHIGLLDAFGNVSAPTTLTISLESSSPSNYAVTSSVAITSGTESTQFKVDKNGNANNSGTITAKATGFTNLAFEVKK
jgi:S-adenosylmethionine hydrolase